MSDWTELSAKDVMSSPVRAIELELSVEEALRILSEERVTGAPVVDGRGGLVGVVTLVDLANFMADAERELGELGTFYSRGFLTWDRESDSFSNFDFREDPLRNTLIDSVMSTDLIAVTSDAPLTEVVRRMAEEEVHRVLVVDEGRLEGLISTSDVIKMLAGTLPVSSSR